MIAQIVVAILYANLVEYLLHRFVMHGISKMDHLGHHAAPEKWTLLLKADVWLIYLFHVLVFAWYFWVFVATIGLYLAGLEIAHVAAHAYHTRHHMLHHDYPFRRFNVWLPICDFFFRTL